MVGLRMLDLACNVRKWATTAETAHTTPTVIRYKVVASLLPRLKLSLAALRVPLLPYGVKTMRSAVVSCPLAPQASQASISVPRHLWALRSSSVRPLVAVILHLSSKAGRHG